MTTVPQELLDAILQEVDDTTALKACALVAPSFRESSQRILLSSLMLDGYRARSPSALLALFIESPHLPAYITTFKLRLSSLDIRTRDTSLRDVLASLNNVRRFTIAGASSAESWDDIISVVPGLIDFIERQTLAELHLFFLHKIPIPILARFASSAATVTFCVALAMHGETKDLPIPFPPPRMTQLVLSDQAETICDVLSRPQFAPYMAALRRLKLRPQHPYSSNIISSAAHGLEHLRLDCSSMCSTLNFDIRSRQAFQPTHPISCYSSLRRSITLATYDGSAVHRPNNFHCASECGVAHCQPPHTSRFRPNPSRGDKSHTRNNVSPIHSRTAAYIGGTRQDIHRVGVFASAPMATRV
jgi:hypothetical protein